MKKEGFIATSLIYSFFLVFLAIIAALLSNYIGNKTILDRYNDDAAESLNRNPFVVVFLTYNAEIRSNNGKLSEPLDRDTSILIESVSKNKNLTVQYFYENYTISPVLECMSENGNWSFEENSDYSVDLNKATLKLKNINDNITCTMRWLE